MSEKPTIDRIIKDRFSKRLVFIFTKNDSLSYSFNINNRQCFQTDFLLSRSWNLLVP